MAEEDIPPNKWFADLQQLCQAKKDDNYWKKLGKYFAQKELPRYIDEEHLEYFTKHCLGPILSEDDSSSKNSPKKVPKDSRGREIRKDEPNEQQTVEGSKPSEQQSLEGSKPSKQQSEDKTQKARKLTPQHDPPPGAQKSEEKRVSGDNEHKELSHGPMSGQDNAKSLEWDDSEFCNVSVVSLNDNVRILSKEKFEFYRIEIDGKEFWCHAGSYKQKNTDYDEQQQVDEDLLKQVEEGKKNAMVGG